MRAPPAPSLTTHVPYLSLNFLEVFLILRVLSQLDSLRTRPHRSRVGVPAVIW